MATVVVQFNKKRKEDGSLFTFYDNQEIGTKNDLKDEDHYLLKGSYEQIKKRYEENIHEKIILILHDENLKKAMMFINNYTAENGSEFTLKARIEMENCKNLFKSFYVVGREGVKGFVGVHTSEIFDDFYKLLEIDKNYGIPKCKLSDPEKRDIDLRQKDRVIYSDMYKRLVDKAQIYSARKSIYVRNRLSHTNEVAAIAETIARSINKEEGNKINVDLSRTIALAHDLGHTPFGHAGERAIEEFLEDKDTGFKFFKHNYNGVRVLTYLEESYGEHYGLNLSPAVCAGVLGHTSLSKKHKDTYDENKETFFLEFQEYIRRYFNYYGEVSDYNTNIFNLLSFVGNKLTCTFAEGQIVACADEIAQKGHDIEDAILAKLVTVQEVLSTLESYANYNGKEKSLFKGVYEGMKKEVKVSCENTKIIAKRINSIIINALVNDLVDNVKKTGVKLDLVENGYIRCKPQGISFSKDAVEFIEVFDLFTKMRIINSKEVVSYDKHGDRIIKDLLNEYLEDIRLLPMSVLKKINYQLYKEEKNFKLDFSRLNFRDVEYIRGLFEKKEKQPKKAESKFDKRIKEVILRSIVDYISSITDSYAEKVHEDIFKTKINSY